MEILRQPWPWYLTGAIIGLTVPALLLLGNKRLGISSTLRQACAACGLYPTAHFDWKKDQWNIYFVAGVVIGGFIGGVLLRNPDAVAISANTNAYLQTYGIETGTSLIPESIFNWQALLTLRGVLLLVVGGFFVGFGTRYAGGCTSGHAIMGLSNLQWPSLVATISFMAGGFIMANLILPYILKL